MHEGETMDGKIKIKGQLKYYMQWPLILTVLLVLMDVLVFTVNRRAGALVSIFVAAYILIVVFLYFHSRAVIMNELISFATQYGQVQKTLLKEFIVPYALLDYNGKILWMNDAFAALSGKNRRYRKSVTNLFPELTRDKLPTEQEAEIAFQYEEKDYRAVMRPISLQRLLEESGLVEPEGNNDLTALYLFDETELMKALFMDVNPIPVKEALNLMGYQCGPCRMPLAPLSEAAHKKLVAVMKKYGLVK